MGAPWTTQEVQVLTTLYYLKKCEELIHLLHLGKVHSYKVVGKKAKVLLKALLDTATPKLERKWIKVMTFLRAN